MTIAELKEVLQFTCDADNFVPKTKELYLREEIAEKDGKVYQKVLVLWML